MTNPTNHTLAAFFHVDFKYYEHTILQWRIVCQPWPRPAIPRLSVALVDNHSLRVPPRGRSSNRGLHVTPQNIRICMDPLWVGRLKQFCKS